MRLIDKIKINYFRSLYSAQIDNAGDLNVLFGRNDSGKSNFLRALNLFFNNKIENTDPEFREHFDFRLNLSDARKKADKKFVWIRVTFNVPEKYKGSLGAKAIVKKQWNTQGQIPTESWLLREGKQIKSSDLTSRQKAQLTRFLNDIDFTYIPAVKDLESFADLVERMYAAVAESEQLKQKTNAFIDAIGRQATPLITQLRGLFGDNASLAPPTEMKRLFRNLDFSIGDEKHSLLKQKGDGVKARHIPELLHFINEVEQRKKLFLWGFEEPENSLDLGAASAEARRFFEFSKRDDTQIFITSHSPAFYLADMTGGEEAQARRFFIRKQKGSNPDNISPTNAAIIIDTIEDAEEAMEESGLLQLPFVIRRMKEREEALEKERDRANELYDEAQRLHNDLKELNTPTLFVEGKHDVQLFEAALNRIKAPKNIKVRPLGGTPKNQKALLTAVLNEGGIVAGAHTLFLFDNDKAGRNSFKKICGQKCATAEPVTINQSAWAWVLPLSNEYRDFLNRWNLNTGSAFFPAEFLFPANNAAKLYNDILEAQEKPPVDLVHGDIWDAVKSDQKMSSQLLSLKPGTVDWFFSRGVLADLKELFAQKTQKQGLDTSLVDSIVQKTVEFLVPKE